MTQSESVTVHIHLTTDGEPDELYNSTRSLQREVADLNVDSVRPASLGPAPEGTKSAEALAVGALIVTLAPVVVPALVDLLKTWTARQTATPTKIKLTIGDRVAEVEYDPLAMTDAEISSLVKKMQRTLTK